MDSIAEYTIPFQDFPFGQACAEFLGQELEIECLKTTRDSTRVYFWVRNEQSEPLEDVDQSPFQTLIHLDTVADDSLFRTDWPDSQESVLKGICRGDATIESVTRNSQEWTIRLQTESPTQLSTFQRYCREHDFDVRLTRFPDLVHLYNSTEFKLTEKQHETLTLAYAEGYFNHPHDVTLDELGEKLNVTRPAVLSRLQNGHRNLLENTILRPVDTSP